MEADSFFGEARRAKDIGESGIMHLKKASKFFIFIYNVLAILFASQLT